MKNRIRNQSRFSRQSGLGLIEVMIGLFVLAIGLLGMASLQNKAVRMNNTSYLYSQATLLASDIVERARANRDAVASYAYGYNDTATYTTDCGAATCTGSQMAAWDVVQWRADIASSLPRGEGEVDIDDDEITVQIKFDDDTGDSTDASYEPLQIQIISRI